MTRFRLVAGLAALAVLAGTSASFAAPNAYADGDFELRQRPLDAAPKVNYVQDGASLTITECRRDWCFAQVPGTDGWIRADRVVWFDRDNGNDDGGFVIGNGGRERPGSRPDRGPSRPGRPDQGRDTARACFFEDENFGGRSFCVRAGQSVPNVGWQWNDSITAVRLYGGATVEACEDENFGGKCIDIRRSTANVGWQWNDTITSLSVY